MADYALKDLQRIRKIREERAQGEVAASRRALETAIGQVEESKKELARYIDWRIETEEKLHADVRGKIIGMRELEGLRANVAALREREIEYHRAVELKEKAVDDAKAKLEESRQALKSATRELQKIEEHKRVWMGEKRREEEIFADKEMEEFRSISTGEDEEAEEGHESYF